LQDLLSDRNVAAFICRHESGGREWFVKERWELLLDWLLLGAMLGEVGDAKTGKISAARKKSLDKGQRLLTQRAMAAGFRIDLFISGETAE
jgi:DNA mismatch repair protein MutH